MDALTVNQEYHAGLAQLKTRLEHELDHLREGIANLDPSSNDEGERWAHELYQRLIRRRSSLLALFFSPS